MLSKSIKKLARPFNPKFSNRERIILRECCNQSYLMLEKQDNLTPDIAEIKEDIKKIMTKLESTT